MLRQAADSDEKAFAAVYDVTASRVYGVALKVVRDPAQAQEVAQEAYLDVWRHAARFDEKRGSAISWILTITHSQAVNRVRSSESQTMREVIYHRQGLVDHPAFLDPTSDIVQASFEAKRVRRALTCLSKVQRESLELTYFGGYTHTQVAALLDLPLGTVKSRIRDGLLQLRELMADGTKPPGGPV